MDKIKIILAVVALAMLGGGVYIYSDYLEQKNIAEARQAAENAEKERKAAEELAFQSRTKCTTSGDYSIITFDRDGQVGQDILVKAKGAECKYVASEGDFELKNQDPEYFKALEAKALVTDVGTGPSGRSLRLYDLGDKSLITEKKYFGDMVIKDGTLTYFGESKTKADKKNCSDFAKITEEGFTPVFTVEKIVDLKTFLVKETKNTKCVSVQ
jgi:hypothetical protein